MRPTIVLLHHFGGSSTCWEQVIDALAGRHECVALDLRGFGQAAANPGPFTVAAMASDVCAAASGFGDYILVGHSMGGKVAMAAAARRPAGLRGVVLLAPSPPTPEPIEDTERVRLLTSWGDRGDMTAIVKTITFRSLSPILAARLVDDMLASSRPAWSAWLTHGSREDIAHLINRIEVPVVVVSGDEDEAIPARVVRREVIARLHGAELVVVEGAGHLLPLEAAGEIAALISAFATTVDRQNAA